MDWLRKMHNCGELDLEKTLGNLLRFGVLASAVVVIVGSGFHLAHHGTTSPDYGVFEVAPAELSHVSGIVRSSFHLEPDALIQLGLLLLLATPIARVAFSVFAFACQRDWLYVVFTLVVLAILVCSIVFGHA